MLGEGCPSLVRRSDDQRAGASQIIPRLLPCPAQLAWGHSAQEETVSSLMPQHRAGDSPYLRVQPWRSWSGEAGTGWKVKEDCVCKHTRDREAGGRGTRALFWSWVGVMASALQDGEWRALMRGLRRWRGQPASFLVSAVGLGSLLCSPGRGWPCLKGRLGRHWCPIPALAPASCGVREGDGPAEQPRARAGGS